MRVTVNGISVYYEVRGSKGPSIVMLHGNGETHRVFDRAVDYLEQKFVVYLPDTRGHGESSPPVTGEYHYQDLADDLSEFVRKLKINKPIIVGYSDGGISALIFASQHPDVPSRVFACGANTKPSALKGPGMALARMRDADDPKVRMMLTEPDITAEMLSRITCPVTVVAGSRDCVRREDTDFIANSVKDGKVCIMKRADHSNYIVHSTRIVDAILADCGVDPAGMRVVDRWSRGGFSATPLASLNKLSGINERWERTASPTSAS